VDNPAYVTQIVMFGKLDSDEIEHSLVPIAKLIDFGNAKETTNDIKVDNDDIETYDETLGLVKDSPNIDDGNGGHNIAENQNDRQDKDPVTTMNSDVLNNPTSVDSSSYMDAEASILVCSIRKYS
jgi:hypothetical protein